jgi:SpoIID/LytB domain protein
VASFTVTDTDEFGNGGCLVEFSDGTEWPVGPCDLSVELTAGDGDPPHFVELAGCRGSSCTYGWGTQLHFADNATHDPGFPGFDVVVQISTDDYVRGIAEVPYSWPVEILKTQAIAARSYAASRAVAVDHAQTSCFCDVRNDSFDQVYAGWVGNRLFAAEWHAAASATASQVITHDASPFGKIVRAYYSSSNGGASESSADKWGGLSYPFLVSIDDPWSLNAANPYASWTVNRPMSDLAGWLGISDVRGASVISRNDSGSPRTFEFTGFDASGNVIEVTKSVESVRARYGLRSWFFEITLDPATNAPPIAGAERTGVHDPTTGIWHLRNANGSVSSFYYGNPRDLPYAGDWDGDGIVTLGLYRQSTGFLFLRNSNTQGVADIQIFYGNPGDIPIAGDWDGDGVDTVGIFRPSEAKFYLRNTNTQGTGDVGFAFGDGGDVPIAGDWNGDGIDTVGLYRPANKTVYLANDLSNPRADFTWVYSGAASGDRIIAGDWNSDGIDTVGLFRPSEAKFYLRDGYGQPSANIVFEMGESFMTPIAGWWGG